MIWPNDNNDNKYFNEKFDLPIERFIYQYYQPREHANIWIVCSEQVISGLTLMKKNIYFSTK